MSVGAQPFHNDACHWSMDKVKLGMWKDAVDAHDKARQRVFEEMNCHKMPEYEQQKNTK